MAVKIKGGRQCRAQKVVIYGPEGIGKTTLASRFPDPLFLDLECGSEQLDVKRLEGVTDWNGLKNVTGELLADPSVCRTLVIDTADRAEALAAACVCREKDVKSLEDIPYGKGSSYLAEEFGRLLACMDDVIAAGIHVVFISHGKLKKIDRPGDAGAYDRWELNLDKNVAPLLKQWADMLLFLTYRDAGTEGGGTRERVICTAHEDLWDAKNRHGLPEVLPLSFDSIRTCFEGPAGEKPDAGAGDVPEEKESSARQRLAALMEKDNVAAGGIRKIVEERGYAPKDTPVADYDDRVVSWILQNWTRFREISQNA